MRAPFAPGDVVEKFATCPHIAISIAPIGAKTVCLAIHETSFHDGYKSFSGSCHGNTHRRGCVCGWRLYEPPKPEVKTTEKAKEKTE